MCLYTRVIFANIEKKKLVKRETVKIFNKIDVIGRCGLITLMLAAK